MASLHGAKQLLGKLATAAAAIRTNRQIASSPEVEVLAPASPLRMTRLSAAFAPLVNSTPLSSLDTPSMMSIPERQFLFGLASRYYAGKGIIVDAGIFLGASTRCFGEGVRSNPACEEITQNWPQPIVSFERAIVNPNMPDFFKSHGLAFSAAQGESFEAELRRNIEPVKDLIDLRIGDFNDAAGVDSPVEILFLDILKGVRLSLHALRLFYPKLIPGRSIVIQQDYFYERLPWIKTQQEALAAYFDFVGEIGSSAIFLCTKEIPRAAVDELDNDMTHTEQLRLASIAMQRSADPNRRFLMALSKTRLIRKLQGRVPARAYLDVVKAEFPEQVAQSSHQRLSQALREIEEIFIEKPERAPKGDGRADKDRPLALFDL